VNLVVFAPAAEADLLDIARYIAADNPRAADRVIDAIHEKAQLLASEPELGRHRGELAPRLRSLPVGPYVIFYRLVPGGIEVGYFTARATSHLSSDPSRRQLAGRTRMGAASDASVLTLPFRIAR
jgi:toxin ParE1/3/4